jgi:hypothetical protein
MYKGQKIIRGKETKIVEKNAEVWNETLGTFIQLNGNKFDPYHDR